jgi:hypothetical protein
VVVIAVSLAGMCAARVLTDFVDNVTTIDCGGALQVLTEAQ